MLLPSIKEMFFSISMDDIMKTEFKIKTEKQVQHDFY